MKPYHNKGFGMAFFVVFLLLIPLPILGLWAVDGKDWSDRFAAKYFSPWQSECWANIVGYVEYDPEFDYEVLH